MQTRDHLSLPSVDFGPILAGQLATRTVWVENVSGNDLTVTVQASAHAAASPASFTLGPAGSATAGRDLEIHFSSGQIGDYAEGLGFSVTHAGAATPRVETMDVTASVRGPSPLSLSIQEPEYSLSGGDTFNFGLVTDYGYPYIDRPIFHLVITNEGELPVQNLTIEIGGGPPAPVTGTCVAQPNVTVCVGPDSSLGTLNPGASVTTLWQLLPQSTGPVESSFEIRAEQAETVTFSLSGEITPFTTFGEKFLTPEIAEELVDPENPIFKVANMADPEGEDKLGTLRVTGFDARTVFSVGELDAVDLRTGNLTFIAPIGGPQAVRGPLGYELNAVLNSTVWKRISMGTIDIGVDRRPKFEPINAEYPNPIFNLGWGGSFHLGRLFEPRDFQGQEPSCGDAAPTDPLAFEDFPNQGPRFLYVDPNGTQHEFWANLHGAVEDPEDLEPDPDNPGQMKPKDYPNQTTLYTRDGSYLRLTKHPEDEHPENRWWLEQPDGTRRLFERQSILQPTMPDTWLLKEIRDLYGNVVTITYGLVTIDDDDPQPQAGWTIADNQGWREVKVAFRNWEGRREREPMIVDAVQLPGFRGGEAGGDPPRIYRFEYTNLTLGRPPRSSFHKKLHDECVRRMVPLDVNVTAPRLDAIVQPDESRYTFGYDTVAFENDLLLTSVGLPSGGTLSYQYEQLWDSPPDCRRNAGLEATPGVTERTASDADGRLSRKRYLRQVRKTSDVPHGICQVHEPTNHSDFPPWSEQVVVEWTEQEIAAGGRAGLSTASAHYFNIYPFDDRCNAGMEGCVGGHLASGRTHVERNLQISRVPDNKDGDLFLSSRTYSCDVDLDNGPAIGWDDLNVEFEEVGDRVDDLLSACTPEETTYAKYEVSRSGRCGPFSFDCSLDSRVLASKTAYEADTRKDPGDPEKEIPRWVRVDYSDFDGLGHYRRSSTRSALYEMTGPEVRTTFRNFHPDAGTLTLDSQHNPLTHFTPPTVWSLGHYREYWTQEGGAYRGGEARFDPTLGHQVFDRTWTSTTCNPTLGIAACRSAHDLVVQNSVDEETGELELRRFFGADTFSGMSTAADWYDAATFDEDHDDYTIDFTYDFGVLSQQRVDGETVYEVRRAIDRNTGWTKTETLNSGEVLTLDYDEMGRTEWITSQETASHHFDYDQDSQDGRWQLTETVYPKGTTSATVSPSAIRKYTARYDGLGRLRSEDLPLYNDKPNNPANRHVVTRAILYHPSGKPFKITSLDNPTSASTRFLYDYQGRLLEQHEPDDSEARYTYGGIRAVTSVRCVKTANPDGGGFCPGGSNALQRAATITQSDFAGRVVKVEAPEGFKTEFDYDPLGNRTRAVRSQGTSTSQARTWTYNGLSFRTTESIPERSAITFSNFNTRGQARTVSEAGRTTTNSYDGSGRLTRLEVGTNHPVKTFTYGTGGSKNGKLTEAERYNYRDAATSGVPGKSGVWRVASALGYDAAGRLNSRSTAITWVPDVGASSGTTTFGQGWTYDDLGNPKTITYPNCVNTTPNPADPDNPTETPCGPDRTVELTYSQGLYLTGVTEGDLGASLTYHGSGLVHEVTHAGSGHGIDTYDVANGMPRISHIDLARTSGFRRDLGDVGYDWAGNVTAVGSDDYLYDADSRLVRAEVGAKAYAYDYDLFDNLVKIDDLTLPGTGEIHVNELNHNHLNGIGWTYDTYGNLETGGGYAMTYDELDKLVAVDPPAGDTQLSLYDHDDLRVMRADFPSGGVTWTLRDGLRVLRELKGVNPAIIVARDYVYAGSRRLASQAYPTADLEGPIRHYHEDQIGSARAITGSGHTEVDYEPFGLTLRGSDERAVGFAGHEDDGLTTYMRGRTYYPLGGRFLQVDPGRESRAWSQYAYAQGNPLSLVDPLGSASHRPHAADSNIVTAFFYWNYVSSPQANAEKAAVGAIAFVGALSGGLIADVLTSPLRLDDNIDRSIRRRFGHHSLPITFAATGAIGKFTAEHFKEVFQSTADMLDDLLRAGYDLSQAGKGAFDKEILQIVNDPDASRQAVKLSILRRLELIDRIIQLREKIIQELMEKAKKSEEDEGSDDDSPPPK